MTAPVYFIMAGSQPGEGAVITRDRNFLTDLWALNVSASVPNSWYLLETNYVSIVPYLVHIYSPEMMSDLELNENYCITRDVIASLIHHLNESDFFCSQSLCNSISPHSRPLRTHYSIIP